MINALFKFVYTYIRDVEQINYLILIIKEINNFFINSLRRLVFNNFTEICEKSWFFTAFRYVQNLTDFL